MAHVSMSSYLCEFSVFLPKCQKSLHLEIQLTASYVERLCLSCVEMTPLPQKYIFYVLE